MKSQNKQFLQDVARRSALFALPLFMLASVSVGPQTAFAVGTKPVLSQPRVTRNH